MTFSARNPRHVGVYPVVPTTFTASGDLDLPSHRICCINPAFESPCKKHRYLTYAHTDFL